MFKFGSKMKHALVDKALEAVYVQRKERDLVSFDNNNLCINIILGLFALKANRRLLLLHQELMQQQCNFILMKYLSIVRRESTELLSWVKPVGIVIDGYAFQKI